MNSSNWSTWLMLGAFALLAYNFYRSVAGKASPKEVRALVEKGALLIDVRTAAEYSSGHLSSAKNIPVGELAGRLKELGEPQQPIVVYCRSGARSGSAAGLLKKRGFTQVYDLGAMSRWE